MNRLAHLPIFCLLTFTLAHCKGFNTGNEPETYTWSGTIYEGLGEQPLANREIELIYFEQRWSSSAPRSEIIATGQTDANGYFELTYEKFTDKQMGDEDGLWLYVSEHDAVAEYFPWNVDIQRDFAERDHSRVAVELTVDSKQHDTVYLTVPHLVQGDYTRFASFDVVNIGYNIVALPCTADEMSILLIELWGGQWDNAPVHEFDVSYGTDFKVFSLAVQAWAIDSVDDDFQRIPFSPRGFPFTDTVHLVIE